jgi:uroporphyrinogen-III synthase
MPAAKRFGRLLHLAGRDRTEAPRGAVATAITVYASEALAVDTDDLRRIEHAVVLLHSVRAASRLDALADDIDRATVRLAAISDAVAQAAGDNWGRCAIAAAPDDAALVALAARLAD